MVAWPGLARSGDYVFFGHMLPYPVREKHCRTELYLDALQSDFTVPVGTLVPSGIWRCGWEDNRQGQPAASVGVVFEGGRDLPSRAAQRRGRRRASCRGPRGSSTRYRDGPAAAIRLICAELKEQVPRCRFCCRPLVLCRRRGGSRAPQSIRHWARGRDCACNSAVMPRPHGPASRTRLRSRRRGRAEQSRGAQPALYARSVVMATSLPSRRSHGRMSPSQAGGTRVLSPQAGQLSIRRWAQSTAGCSTTELQLEGRWILAFAAIPGFPRAGPRPPSPAAAAGWISCPDFLSCLTLGRDQGRYVDGRGELCCGSLARGRAGRGLIEATRCIIRVHYLHYLHYSLPSPLTDLPSGAVPRDPSVLIGPALGGGNG